MNKEELTELIINSHKENAKKVALAVKHFGDMECEPLLSLAVDEEELNRHRHHIEIGCCSININPQIVRSPKSIIIDIDPAFPYVLVRHIIKEKACDNP